MMAKVVDHKQKKWVEFLPFITAVYNTTIHHSAGFSPNFLFFGRELSSPLDVALGLPPEESLSVNDYAQYVCHRMAEANALVRMHARKRTAGMKQQYDGVVRPATFEPDDLVRYYYPRKLKGRSPKWSRYYVGPYRIVKRVNDVIRLNDRARAITDKQTKTKQNVKIQANWL